MNKSSRAVKYVSILGCIVLLAACGSQVANTTVATAKTGSLSNSASTSGDSKLLASLADTYPNGQLPSAFKTQAEIALAQNPAVLKMSASSVVIANNNNGQIVVTTCTPTNESTCSLIGSKLYLLTPQ